MNESDEALPRPQGIADLSQREAELLGMNTSISRRDFVGSTLLGAGAALLGAASPGAIRSAAAQTVSMPMTGLDANWTGPVGIGDYGRSNGNTHDVLTLPTVTSATGTSTPTSTRPPTPAKPSTCSWWEPGSRA